MRIFTVSLLLGSIVFACVNNKISDFKKDYTPYRTAFEFVKSDTASQSWLMWYSEEEKCDNIVVSDTLLKFASITFLSELAEINYMYDSTAHNESKNRVYEHYDKRTKFFENKYVPMLSDLSDDTTGCMVLFLSAQEDSLMLAYLCIYPKYYDLSYPGVGLQYYAGVEYLLMFSSSDSLINSWVKRVEYH